jgi:CubicO group peptidase (beta-lactamase class C family)
VRELLESATGIPGAVVSYGSGPAALGTWAIGKADTTTGRPMTEDTVFDLASLTKVVATTTVALALIADGRLALSDPVARHVPAASWPGPVTVRHLLTHTSGLPASARLHEGCGTRDQLLSELYRIPLEAPPGTRVTYSDLGYIVLGELVAGAAGLPLDKAVGETVIAPLGLTSTGYNPAGPAERFAATELRADGTPWTGVVHDENARAMGGVAGHAGLFSTAADLARFAQWWVSPADGPVPVWLRREATTCQTDGLPGQEGYPGRRGLGWTCPGDRFDILGDVWPPTAVSHTGFTGTSLALDSPSGRWVVLLTNGVHFGRDPAAIKSLRRAVHTALAPAP